MAHGLVMRQNISNLPSNVSNLTFFLKTKKETIYPTISLHQLAVMFNKFVSF